MIQPVSVEVRSGSCVSVVTSVAIGVHSSLNSKARWLCEFSAGVFKWAVTQPCGLDRRPELEATGGEGRCHGNQESDQGCNCIL